MELMELRPPIVAGVGGHETVKESETLDAYGLFWRFVIAAARKKASAIWSPIVEAVLADISLPAGVWKEGSGYVEGGDTCG